MKIFALLAFVFISTLGFAQDSATYFSLYERKVYTLKNKGVRDFVVDVTSSRLTDQVNEQKIFGTIKKLIFRVHWTLSPERLAVDVIGLPEGFFEAKAELKAAFVPVLDSLLPMGVAQRFPGYKIAAGKSPKEFIATDPTGVAPIPSYTIKFDEQDRLSEIIGNKPVGTWDMNYTYDKKAFAEGRWVVSQVVVNTTENGVNVKTTRKLSYGDAQGMGVLSEVALTVEQTGDKGFRNQDTIEFENYRINTGEGMRYFLGDAPVSEPPKKTP